MIVSLTIQNYALIRELKMSPSSHLSIITGETGAGKSIMLGAVGLLLGNRADTKALWDESKKCLVEGVFSVSQYSLKGIFDQHELDYEDECIIRREISPSGKSRAFINDTPVTLDILKQLGSKLMDIHSQHESLQLGSNQYQEFLLDTFSQHEELLSSYKEQYSVFQEKKKEFSRLKNKAEESAKELDYQQFLLKELNESQLDQIDQEKLENELTALENAEEIKQNLSHTEQILDHEEMGVLTHLKDAVSNLRSISKYGPKFKEIQERLDSSSIELADILSEVVALNEDTILDPDRQAVVKSRLDTLYRLQQKHGLEDVAALIELRDNISAEVHEVESLDEKIEHAKAEAQKAGKNLEEVAKKLTESRKKHASILAGEVEKQIHQLGIENGKVEIRLEELPQPAATGNDLISILFSANKGVAPREIKEVASGGEFSRLIFSLKFLLADKTSLPTIIFDEIDTGVSGEIALKMIHMMRKMSQSHQIISISHLPQFAAGGDAHYYVYKDHSTDKSETKVKLLLDEERVEAIAKMIGGNSPSEKAYESARELLQHPAI